MKNVTTDNNKKEKGASFEDNEFLSELFMQAPAFIALLLGPNHIFKLANERYRQLVGKNRNIIGKSVIEALPEVKDQGFIELLDNVYNTGEPFIGNETKVQIDREGTGDLEPSFVNFVYQPYKNSKGEIQGVFAHGVDVTEQVKARKQIAESEKKYRSLFESMDQGFCILEMIWDENNKPVDYRFVETNPVFEKQTGMKEALGKTAKTLVPDLENHWLELYGNIALTRQPRRFTEKSDAMGRSFEVYAFPFGKDESNNVALLFSDITDRLKSEEILRKNEQTLQTYIEAMPQMAFVADAKGSITYYNKRWYEYIGRFEGTEGWGWKNYPIHHPDDFERAIRRWSEAIETGKQYDIEYRLRRHDGQYRWHLGRAEPVYDSNGNIEMWLGTNTDIHEQKLAEEAFRKSKDYYKTMTDNTPVMTWVTDSEGYCIFLNKQWYDYTGQEVQASLGKGWLEAVHPGDYENSEAAFVAAHKAQVPYSCEFRLRAENGSYRWHLDTGLPKFDDKGKYEGLVGSVVDIHERKMAEVKLQESEEFSRTLLESSPDSVKAINLDGKLISINQQGLSAFGLESVDQIKGKKWSDFWKGEYHEKAISAIEKVLKGEIAHFQGETHTAKKELKWWDVLLAPVYSAEGKVARLVCVSRDITQLKKLENEKDQFIGIASHELKTPVTSIKGFIQIMHRLLQQDSVDKVMPFLNKAESQVDKLTGLINDLLDVSKIQAGKMRYDFSTFPVKEIINDSVDHASHFTEGQKIIVEGDLSTTVYGDKDRLEQVMVNLITNAIKYSPGTDKIFLNVSCEGEFLKVSVTDFGIGIPEEMLENVFERFFRVEKSSQHFQGVGLGLYICSEIIKRHEGTIKAESTEKEGTIFSFKLPIQKNSKDTQQ